MDHSVYPVERKGSELVFVFISKNAYETNPIRKVVTYADIIRRGVRYFGLGFGDHNTDDGYVYDNVVSDNSDMRKVLKTVAYMLNVFFIEYPREKVLIEGRDRVRNSYYQKIVRDYYELISTRYKVEGFVDGRTAAFQPNVMYDFITISIK